MTIQGSEPLFLVTKRRRPYDKSEFKCAPQKEIKPNALGEGKKIDHISIAT